MNYHAKCDLYCMKNFESSLRPVSADKRLVAREVAFNPNPLHQQSPSFMRHGPSTKPDIHDKAQSTMWLGKSRPYSQGSITTSGLTREVRSERRLKEIERRCSLKRDREYARLQLERAWLKRKIVLILKLQEVHESST